MAVNDGKVPATAQIQGGAHTYAISFTPKQALAHLVHLRFNGENVPGRAPIVIYDEYLFCSTFIVRLRIPT